MRTHDQQALIFFPQSKLSDSTPWLVDMVETKRDKGIFIIFKLVVSFPVTHALD